MKTLIVTVSIPDDAHVGALESVITHLINTITTDVTVLNIEVEEHEPEYYGINSDAVNESKEPKFLGTGIHVHEQFKGYTLVVGDTFFDADYGYMIWNGEEWVYDNREDRVG